MQDRFVELEGTWEEIRAHDAELAGKRVRLTVLEAAGAADAASKRAGITDDSLLAEVLAQMEQGIDLGGRPYLKREELYDRFDRNE